jgi:hypothetical protein
MCGARSLEPRLPQRRGHEKRELVRENSRDGEGWRAVRLLA